MVSLQDLLSDQVTLIAIANPEHAPYGLAAKEALQSAGVWEQVQAKIVFGENIRQTLQFIQTGDTQVGIVALSVADVPEISWTLIDDSLYNPLDQALAVVTDSPHQELARQFAAFINSPLGQSTMQKYGFVLPVEPTATPSPVNELFAVRSLHMGGFVGQPDRPGHRHADRLGAGQNPLSGEVDCRRLGNGAAGSASNPAGLLFTYFAWPTRHWAMGGADIRVSHCFFGLGCSDRCNGGSPAANCPDCAGQYCRNFT